MQLYDKNTYRTNSKPMLLLYKTSILAPQHYVTYNGTIS